MNRLKLFIPLIIFLVVAVFLFLGIGKDPSHLPSTQIGKPLPEFELPALEEEKIVVRKDLIGEPFLLNVWATWCPGCLHEMPFLITLAERGVKIVGLNYRDENDKALAWLERLGNPYVTNLVDPEGRLAVKLGVYGAPETYLVDKEGIIRYRHAGDVNDRVWKSTLAPIFGSL